MGSSGGIFGLLGAAIVFGWRHRHQLHPETSRFFRIKLVPWVVLNLVIGVVVPVIDDLGLVGVNEPLQKLYNQGMILSFA